MCSRDQDAQDLVVLFDPAQIKVSAKDIGTAGVGQSQICYEPIIVPDHSPDRDLVCIPEPPGLGRAPSEQPHPRFQANMVSGMKNIGPVRFQDVNNKAVELHHQTLTSYILFGN